MTVSATITPDESADGAWDVLVVGAGPAGAVAARQAARHGLRTLLVDAKRFPRDKVCGGCLNQRALAALRQAGLEPEVARCDGVPLDRVRVVTRGRAVVLPLPAGQAVWRTVFDVELIQAAIAAGVRFLPETQATVAPAPESDCRHVMAGQQKRHLPLAARVVVVADGLSRSSLKLLPEFKSHIAPGSRIGAGGTLESGGADHPPGQITMAVSRAGYVGLTQVGGGRLNVAAALDPAGLQQGRSIVELVTNVLDDAGISPPAGLSTTTWHGTPSLTSRPGRLAAERLLLIGDAAGYVEPFTGEGMAAALEGALAIGPIVREGCADWHASLAADWDTMHRRLLGNRQTVCRALAWTVRRPHAVSAAMGVCRMFPAAARRVVSRVNEPATERRSLEGARR